MKQLILIIGLGGLLAAQYIGSYTARISQQDHYSSRGLPLTEAAEILQQDRANYYRFGRADSEDTGVGYFASRRHRAAFGRMLRHGSISRELSREIRYGSPLVRVNIYSRHLEIQRTDTNYRDASPSTPQYRAPSTSPKKILSELLLQDATQQIITYAREHDMGFSTSDIKHRMVGVYFAREGETDIAWAVIATSPRKNYKCHACTPVLSMFVYHKEDDRTWKIKRSAFEAYRGGGGWDNPPDKDDIALVHISPTECVLGIHSGYANMGWLMLYYTLVSARDTGTSILFFTTMHEDNAGNITNTKTDWDSTIQIKPNKDKQYTIYLHRKGVENNRPINYTIRYEYNGRKYLPQGEDIVMKK